MTGRSKITREEDDNEDIVAARWVLAIDAGLEPARVEAFHAWLAASPGRSELIAQQAMLQDLAKQAVRPAPAAQPIVARRANGQVQESRRGFLFAGAVATGVVALGVIALLSNTQVPVSTQAFETATGEVRMVELSDASRLWLDTRTSVSASLTEDFRDVTLAAGRLFVEVAHNPQRPFVVHGANFEARAIGTAFEATVFADHTGVAVNEGVVRLTPANGGPAIDLLAGQAASITRSGEVTQTSMAARSIGGWREHRMVMSDRRLDTALAELSRYFDRPLRVEDAQLAARRVTLSFSIANLGAEDAARIIARAVDADIADQANASVILRPAQHDKDVSGQPATIPR